jgi:hypothetical protein
LSDWTTGVAPGNLSQFGALGFDPFSDFRARVRSEIVDQDDVARRKRRNEHRFDISEETFAIDWAVEDEGGALESALWIWRLA